MSRNEYIKNMAQVTEQLSHPDSYMRLYHKHSEGNPLPSGEQLNEIVNISRAIIFPGYYGKSSFNQETIKYSIGVNIEQLFLLLTNQIQAGLAFESEDDSDLRSKAEQIANDFISRMPEIRKMLAEDVEAAYNGDPAAKDFGEVISCYPVIKALTNYRIAHALLVLGVPLIPRILTEMAHSETGIDIHPGANIGHHFTIDHGTGVVIGETCTIGNNVKLYQGVTLGAKSFPLDADGNPIKGIQRHPTLQDDVIVYSNATILGNITIGRGATIGGNIWVTEDVPAGALISQKRKG